MKIVICGLAITSSWGNGHATTYRALARALHARGHKIVFFERDLEWYASNRDMPEPPFCSVHIYECWNDVLALLRRELDDADVAMVGSYSPDGIQAASEILDSSAAVKTFYDIDTPITISKLQAGDEEYIRRDQVPVFDLYFSFTGGPILHEIEEKLGARRAVPLYCSFDPSRYRLCEIDPKYRCELSYMGTYAPDRQPKLEQLLCAPAAHLSHKKFIIAGPQYPREIRWPHNVQHIIHLEPKLHPPFYCSSRFTLNLTRKHMSQIGYSPSVRLFEAAGCGAPIISDYWEGIESFLLPGSEILLAHSSDDVVGYSTGISDGEARAIGRRAQDRVLGDHSAEKRAMQFEDYIGSKTLAASVPDNISTSS